ncbi:uncharacterized protein KY384_005881 [Bacidia gigantensis]|uniref:uncharacterized protein n=1 Tax=Bacidia gigantensis TaxID=2732470 RepID=UPI001D037F01|nr:uncharacterized protein KY384_005881 [Bacidia gigantensis]KAG8529246.1 hypothetical protein KY384_005881 [Bacidia gigantensis]
MSSEHDAVRRDPRKLSRRRQPIRQPSLKYPERLTEGEDVQDDVTATNGQPAQYMNQSVFSMIAAAGSKVDFHARFDEASSESEEDPVIDTATLQLASSMPTKHPVEAQNTALEETVVAAKATTKHPRLGEKGGFRTLPKLNLRTVNEKTYMSQSIILPSPKDSPRSPKGLTPRDAPVMSKMLEAQADSSLSTMLSKEQKEEAMRMHQEGARKPPSALVLRLKEIFGFEEAEEVIAEYPCWLLQSVLLQGYMYITSKHICFYAYLPKKSDLVSKSGYLSKRGRQNPTYKRSWFTLQGDVLSYYAGQSERYFPSGNIDLRYGISASLSHAKDNSKEVKDFSIITHKRTFHFKADSAASAKEWVKTLQKVIFRSHNDGDSIKISLPIENVIDIEENPVIDFADTFKIRVVDSEETYAIDEYFFSFFSFGKDALDVLGSLIDGTTAQHLPSDLLTNLPMNDGAPSREASQSPIPRQRRGYRVASPMSPRTPVLHDQVRATLMPSSPVPSSQASPRPSREFMRKSSDTSRKSLELGRRSLEVSKRDFSRSSFDRGRRTASSSRTRDISSCDRRKSPSTAPQASMDSFVQSLDLTTGSSAPDVESNNTQASQASGSQILQRSDVFQSPAVRRLQQAKSLSRNGSPARSPESVGTNSPPSNIQVQPPTRNQTEQSLVLKSQIGDRTRTSSSQAQSPTLQQLVRAGGYPLQKAAGFTNYLRTRSKRMSNILATESMGYVEKVSDMWAGGRKHYGQEEGLMAEGIDNAAEEGVEAGYGDRFRAHFALSPSEKLRATYYGYLHRVLPLYGKIYISNKSFCFRSLLPGTKTKMLLPLKDIENVDKEKGFRFGYYGLVVVVRGHEELFFEFNEHDTRDDCVITLLGNLESKRYEGESKFVISEDNEVAEIAKAEHKALQEARQDGFNEHEIKMPTSAERSSQPAEAPPILFDDPRASILNFKPTESLRITCLTIGSRGDVQPYIALCKGLKTEGHRPKIATHAEFEPWIRKHDIDFAPVDGDPAELMRICVENGMFTYSFLREASVKFRSWIDELLSSAWKACQDTDILIESPSAMAGIHIAEALGVPYFRAFTMPWTRTRAYPHAFAVPERKMGGAYNYITYVMFDNVFWKAIAGQVNRWRKKELGLRSTTIDKMQPNKVPFLYNFSPSVVVPPLDYSDWIRVTGYWFLNEATDWTPPEELAAFIRKARQDEKRIVYIGFGSIVVSDPAALTKTVVDSVLKADVRAILSKGWSDRLGNQDVGRTEISLPPEILQIKSAPHDWLFGQIDAAAHHGGAGTTGASLRAGLPTIVKPFFGDQFFLARVSKILGSAHA